MKFSISGTLITESVSTWRYGCCLMDTDGGIFIMPLSVSLEDTYRCEPGRAAVSYRRFRRKASKVSNLGSTFLPSADPGCVPCGAAPPPPEEELPPGAAEELLAAALLLAAPPPCAPSLLTGSSGSTGTGCFVRTCAAMLASWLTRWSCEPLTIPSCVSGIVGAPPIGFWPFGSSANRCARGSTPVRFFTSSWKSLKVAPAGTVIRERPAGVARRTAMSFDMAGSGSTWRGVGEGGSRPGRPSSAWA
mmetsp:Transcript_124937/g.347860  ORF Transcript_124937/g.347860 Transcript_124937/m.347860 type:complete len:247 (+) Transcript_124937:953-1693(+)